MRQEIPSYGRRPSDSCFSIYLFIQDYLTMTVVLKNFSLRTVDISKTCGILKRKLPFKLKKIKKKY